MMIVLWLGLVPAITAVLAGMRGRNVVTWYLLAVPLPVVAAIAVVLLPRRYGAREPAPASAA